MAKKKHLKALVFGAVAMTMSCSMLVGTTFAWFTDSVTSGNNVIATGNLDVELDYWNGTKWNTVKDATDLFTGNLWEPGHTETVYLRLSNEGSLGFKYKLGINVASEVIGKSVTGEKLRLSDYIHFGVEEGVNGETGKFASREAALEAVEDDATLISVGYSALGTMEANAEDLYMAMVVYMPETVGNEANYLKGNAPSIDLGVSVTATQMTAEDDSFGNDYDENAPCDVIATPATINEVLASAQEGDIIGLSDGYYESVALTQHNLTLVSAGDEVKVGYLNLNAKDNSKIINLTFDAAGAKEAYRMTGSSVGTYTGVYANIVAAEHDNYTANGTFIKGCTFTGTATASDFCPIYFYEKTRWSDAMNTFTVDGCTFECVGASYYLYTYQIKGGGNIKITNNVFGSLNATAYGAVSLMGNRSNALLSNNTVYNCEAYGFQFSQQSAYIATVANNHFVSTLDEKFVVANFKSMANCKVIFEDNTANYGRYTLSLEENNGTRNYVMNGTAKIAGASTVTELKNVLSNVQAGEETVIDVGGADLGEMGYTYFQDGVTVMNATISGGYNYGNRAYGTVVFENCNFASSSSYAAHFDAGSEDNKIIFKNCYFSGWNSFGTAIKGVEFENCTFDFNGNYGMLRFYQNATLTNCTFTDAFVRIDTNKTGTKISFTNCTGLTGKIHNNGSNVGVWIVDGVDISSTIA